MHDPPPRSEAVTSWKRWLAGPAPGDRRVLHEEIAALLAAGFGIRESLHDVLGRSSGRRRRALLRLVDAVDHDVPPGRAMARLPEHFSPAEAALVAAGERTGRYDAAFRAAAADVERSRQAAAKVLRAVAYPLFLLHFALFVPACAVIGMGSGGRTARLFVGVVFVLLWTAILGGWTFHVARRATPGWGAVTARLPLAGAVVAGAAISRACRVASALHAAGATLPETFEAAAAASQNGWIAADLRAAADRVTRGSTAAEALAGAAWLGPAARSLVETGERSGSLDASFARIADLEDERHAAALRRLAVALGAAIFLVVALAVAWMLATVLGRLYGGL